VPESSRFSWSGDRGADGGAESEGPEVRLAIYDSPLAAPRVINLRGQEFHQFVGDLAARTYNHSRERGGRIPYVVIREIVENLIHAYFEGAVISIFDDGNTIRIADQGPGIADRQKALLPGFSTATAQMRRFIKGVGSGLPVAKEQLVSALVNDALVLMEATKGMASSPEQHDAVGLLALVAGQDVEPGDEEGTWRIAEKILETVAKEERAERAVKPGKSARAPYARSLALAGSGHSDRTDVSRDKHGHLAEIYAGKPERR